MKKNKYPGHCIIFSMMILFIFVTVSAGCSNYDATQKSAVSESGILPEKNTLKTTAGANISDESTVQDTTIMAATETSEPAPEKEVVIVNDSFQPNEVTISIGEIVKWVNKDGHAHNVASISGEFKSSIIKSGEQFIFNFNNEGIYEYICEIHPNMKGKVIVLK
jgi:plastocyanin